MSLRHLGLRGHHLVCLQFFDGSGYSEEFIDNLRRVMQGFRRKGALVVEGSDDVCAKCRHLDARGTCTLEPGGEQSIRALDHLAMELLDVELKQRVDYDPVRAQVAGILGEWRRHACGDCEWTAQCEPQQRLMARDSRP